MNKRSKPLQQLSVSYVSSIVGHEVPVAPVDGKQKFKAGIGNNNLPLLFSIGEDSVLYFTTQNNKDQTATGWSSYDLTTILGNGATVTTFEVAQDPQSHQFTIWVAIIDKDNITHLYHSPVLLPDFNGQTASGFWSEVTWLSSGINKAKINFISATTGTQKIIIATERPGTDLDADYYSIDNNSCQELSMPADATKICAVIPGRIGIEVLRSPLEGYYLFYKVGESAQVFFQGYSTAGQTQPIIYKYKFADDPDQSKQFMEAIRSIYVLLPLTADHSTILYVAGNLGVLECPDYKSFNIIPGSANLFNNEIIAIRQQQQVIVFVQQQTADQQKFLSYANNYITGNGSWSTLIAFTRDIVAFDCILTLESASAVQLLGVSDSNMIQYFTQDNNTANWNCTPIYLSNNKTRQVSGYAAYITIGDQTTDKQVAGKSVTIHASAEATIIINGAAYQVGPKTNATIILEIGALYVEYYCDQMTSLVLFISSDLFPTEAIDLSRSIIQELKTLNSAAALKAAKDADGNPLIPNVSQLPDDYLNQFANVLQAVITLRQNLIQANLGADNRSLIRKENKLATNLQGGPVVLTMFGVFSAEEIEALAAAAIEAAVVVAVVAAFVAVFLLIWYLTPVPNAFEFAFYIEAEIGILTITAYGRPPKRFEINKEIDAFKMFWLLFSLIGVGNPEKQFYKKKKYDYSCDVKIDTTAGPKGIKEAEVDDKEANENNSNLRVVPQDRTCAIGAKVVARIRVNNTTTGQEQPIIFASWIISGKQIDFQYPVIQNIDQSACRTENVAIVSWSGYEGNVARKAICWLNLGEFDVYVSGYSNALIMPIPFSKSVQFRVVGPNVLSVGTATYKAIKVIKVEQEMVLRTEIDLLTNSAVYIGKFLGPGGDNVLLGGEIGNLQTLYGFREDTDEIGEKATKSYVGSNNAFIDTTPESEYGLFYTSIVMNPEHNMYHLDTLDDPRLDLQDLDTPNDCSQQRVNERFNMNIAFQAPITAGAISSYIVVRDGFRWGWYADAHRNSVKPGKQNWMLDANSQHIPGEPQVIAQGWYFPTWLSNDPEINKHRHQGPMPNVPNNPHLSPQEVTNIKFNQKVSVSKKKKLVKLKFE